VVLNHGGIVATQVGFGGIASLALSLIAAVLFTVGWRLAVAHRYEEHRWVMTAAVIVNAVPVFRWMIGLYWVHVLPRLPGNLVKGVEALTTVHAVDGALGVALGVVIVIRGNQLAAKGLSLSRWKTPMLIAYVAYILGTLLGVVLYYVVYR